MDWRYTQDSGNLYHGDTLDQRKKFSGLGKRNQGAGKQRRKLAALALLLIPIASWASSEQKCTGPSRFAANIAHLELQKEHLITKPIPELGLAIERVASDKIGLDLYRQVHVMTFTEESKSYSVITINDVSQEECSMGPVTVYLVDRKIGYD